MSGADPRTDPNPARARLIDHFKRAYQIIVGLAITLACTKLFSSESTLSFWLFCTFFVTVVPIFHGGDRSLDVKYLDARPQGFGQRASYIWDVYMLLITAVIFVKLAQAIPGAGLGGGTTAAGPQEFYRWMTILMVFDIAVLAIDRFKTALLYPQQSRLAAYLPWGVLNAALALVCGLASLYPAWLGTEIESLAVFVLALLRTILDYCFGSDFLFP